MIKKIIKKLYTHYLDEIYFPEEFDGVEISLIINDGCIKISSSCQPKKDDILLLVDKLRISVNRFISNDEKIDKFIFILKNK